MRGPLIALWFVALSLGWLVFFGAGTRFSDWNAALVFLGATTLFYWTLRTGQTPPRLQGWQLVALWSLPLYAVFQLIPLPPSLLAPLSPARAMLTESVGALIPNIGVAPISVTPAASLFGLISLLAYLATFGLLRDVGWRFVESKAWMPAAPLVAIATAEAAVGVGQWLNSASNAPTAGTFLNSEYFNGLLELALPFTLVFGFISFRRHQAQQEPSSRPATFAVISWGSSVLFLAALFHSPSPATWAVVGVSLYILLALAIVPRLKTRKLRRYGAAAVAGILILVFFFLMPPPEFIESVARLGSSGKPVTTLAIWNNTASLFGEYRWLGTGLGGFPSTFLKFQGSTDLNAVNSPDNDILSLLVSFGIVGFGIVLVVLVALLWPAITGAVYLTNEPRRLLAVSVTASLFGILLRSGLESTFSVPALAMAFAWLAGMGQAGSFE